MKNKNVIYLTAIFSIGLLILIIQSCSNEDDNCTEQTWYKDTDGDGFGNINILQQSCSQPAGYVLDNSDFNDNESSAFPGAIEICNDSIDNDGDSLTDCDDSDCPAHNCIDEICDDGVDNDGDGFTDCEDSECNGTTGC